MQIYLPGFVPKSKSKTPRKLNDVHILVEVWKDIEGIRQRSPADVVAWNKHFFARHAKVCKKLLDYLQDPNAVEACMEDVVRFMRQKGWPYTINTVYKFADRWKIARSKGKVL